MNWRLTAESVPSSVGNSVEGVRKDWVSGMDGDWREQIRGSSSSQGDQYELSV